MDIFKDSTHEGSVSNSLEIDRIKARVIGVWNQLMAATYEIEYKNQSSDDEDFVSWFDRADAALYQAKSAGRDRVVSAG